MNIVHLLYIRVFQHLYFIIILNLVLLFLMSITVVKITIMYLKSSDSESHGE